MTDRTPASPVEVLTVEQALREAIDYARLSPNGERRKRWEAALQAQDHTITKGGLDDDERFVRLADAVLQLRDFLALHRKATGRSDVNIRKVIRLLDDALSDGDPEVRAALEPTHD